MKVFEILKPIIMYLKEDISKVLIAAIIIFLAAIINISYGYLNGTAIEYIIDMNLKMSLVYFLIYLGIQIIANQLLLKKSKLLLRKIELNITKRLSIDVYQKTMKLPVKAFEEKTNGEVINRITSDSETIAEMLNQFFLMFVDVFCSLLVLLYIFYNSWIVGTEIILYLVFIVILTKRFMPIIKKSQEEINKDNDKYMSYVNESIRGIREIKSLGITDRMNKIINNTITNIISKRKKLIIFETKYDYLIETLNAIFEVGVFLTCVILVFYSKVSITFFIAMTYYVYRYMMIVETFTSFSTSYQKVIVALNRINEILNNDCEYELFGKIEIENINGKIEFQNVTFGYEKNEYLLKDFSVEIPTKSKVAIVGKSGQGKSTLFNLLTRMFNPIKGNILIDGVDVKEINEATLRRYISIIRQEPFLFNKTIKENFELISDEINLDEIRKYCKIASIDKYIMSLPMRYDTKIGENGLNLSGGQKQRIAIARALLKKSKIILFDEATSTLDNESQNAIKVAIDRLAKEHTVVIVAHRLSTIMDADIILVVDDGQIKESGTHNELMKKNGIYYNLYENEEL